MAYAVPGAMSTSKYRLSLWLAKTLKSNVDHSIFFITRLERNALRARRHGNMAQNVCRFIADGVSGHVVLLTSWPMLCFLPSVFLFSLAYHSLTVLLPGYLINSG